MAMPLLYHQVFARYLCVSVCVYMSKGNYFIWLPQTLLYSAVGKTPSAIPSIIFLSININKFSPTIMIFCCKILWRYLNSFKILIILAPWFLNSYTFFKLLDKKHLCDDAEEIKRYMKNNNMNSKSARKTLKNIALLWMPFFETSGFTDISNIKYSRVLSPISVQNKFKQWAFALSPLYQLV